MRFRALFALTGLTLALGVAACEDAGEQEPARGAPAAGAEGAATEDVELYTCPMHPQILQEEPGTCPICGMDLVPRESGGAGGSSAGEPEAARAPGAATREREGEGEREILYWVAPMDPSYRRDAPGKSPMGMDLVPVYADEDAGGDAIEVDPVVVQNMGVRTAVVMRRDLARKVRTVGTIEVAEDALSVVNLRYSGWVEEIHVDETGVRVEKGDPLVEVYSPELLSAQEEYLLAVRTSGLRSPLARSARRRLELFGMSDGPIRALLNRGRPGARVTVAAPQSGYVIHKDVVEGARVEAGRDLYRIGDLSTVWIEADVYEFDAPWIEKGAPAEVELTFQPGQTRPARVSYIYPTLDEQTRTLRVRLEMENPDLDLKPGSFATVSIRAQDREDVLVVPTESIIRSGTRELVFVVRAFGKYEPREIETGLAGDGYLTEVLDGVQAGERVVTSGQFLLDSESQLQEAVQKMMESRLQAKAPGETVTTPAADPETSLEGDAPGEQADTYWTCPMHPQIVQEEPGTCPICGMDLVEKEQ